MVLARPSHLGAEAVGNPEVGPNLAEEFLDHFLAARRADHEACGLAVVKDPGPEGPLADADAGLVGLQGGAGEQPLPDPLRLVAEGRGAVRQPVGERALADHKPEQVEHQPFQALIGNRLTEAQRQHEGAQVRSERRARFQTRRCRRLEPLVAARADAAMQRHPGDVRRDLGDFDAVVSLKRHLCHARHIRTATGAVVRQHVAPPRRIGMQRPMRPRMGLTLRLRPRPAVGLHPLRRRPAGIGRRLRWQIEAFPQRRVLGFQRFYPGNQIFNPHQQPGDQRVRLGRRKGGEIGRWSHRNLDSYSRLQRNKNRQLGLRYPHPTQPVERLPGG